MNGKKLSKPLTWSPPADPGGIHHCWWGVDPRRRSKNGTSLVWLFFSHFDINQMTSSSNCLTAPVFLAKTCQMLFVGWFGCFFPALLTCFRLVSQLKRDRLILVCSPAEVFLQQVYFSWILEINQYTGVGDGCNDEVLTPGVSKTLMVPCDRFIFKRLI